MALVPFRVAGAAASQQRGQQLLQVGPHSLLLHQRPKESGNTAHLQRVADRQQEQQPAGTSGSMQLAAAGSAPSEQQQPDLSRVGLVLWQSGYVLSDFLLLRLPQLQAGPHGCSSCWAGARVLELGCGAGTVGMFLALGGAQVVVTDLPHILHLTRENLALNFPLTSAAAASTGNSSSTSSRSDLLYDPTCHQALLSSLQQLCAPHTQVFLCYRCRGLGEEAFHAAVAAAGWAVEEVPCQLLHPEYQAGEYCVLRLMKTG
ncbi:hypothetical protein OEZ85_006815 [Tetradesmus obliquus]|uniref:Methyltransferase small domain-containing protein n=1 Tax=Tetradesmus obliquus TaxID=3088 RepID=A0ABY8TXW6_TETOB|nr:hypothetical protein OEZ85_006815 [Tetradesmus obliquus]